MDKLVRYRKAFYEKENDLQHCNKKKEHLLPSKSLSHSKLYQSLPIHALKPHPAPPKPATITAAYCQDYAQDLLSPSLYDSKPALFLSNHQIDGLLRARMLDWMVQVTASYKFTHKTYFDSAALMDKYFQKETACLPPTQLHIVGVQCMLIASKMEEVYPLKIKTVYDKIAHKKLPLEQLVQTEANIISTLNYQLNSWTFFDLVTLKVSDYASRQQDERQALGELFASVEESRDAKEQKVTKIIDVCSYLAKFALYDYAFYCDCSTLLLAETVLKTTFELMQLTPPLNFFTSPAIQLELCRQKLVKLAKTHKHRFSGLNNLFKFTSKSVIALVDDCY